MYDVIIIGAGVSGSAVARELARYQGKVCVLEKEEDVCCGTSKANSGIVHAGYDCEPGSLMARLNVEGNARMEALSKELDFEFIRKGSLVICKEEEQLPELNKLYEKGIQNGVPGMRILKADEVKKMEPNVTESVVAALYAPSAGIVCPFGLNIALAENAYTNGVEFKFDTEVQDIRKTEKGWELHTTTGIYEAGCIVNAAGVYADRLHNMVSEKEIKIIPRKGEYFLLDKDAGKYAERTLFALPGKYGKGVLISPTVHGNLIVGPTAAFVEDKEDISTTGPGMDVIRKKACDNVKELPLESTITSFAGLRAHEEGHEFLIGEVEGAEGFFDCAGIESPGLTSCPAIGHMLAAMIQKKLALAVKPDFCGTRKGIIRPGRMDWEERKALVQDFPAYGRIVCRCEMISEGEIIDAIRRPLGAKSLDGIKRRTRAGMGRCQSGFCSPRVMEILAEERKMSMEAITKCGKNSYIVKDLV